MGKHVKSNTTTDYGCVEHNGAWIIKGTATIHIGYLLAKDHDDRNEKNKSHLVPQKPKSVSNKQLADHMTQRGTK